MRKRYADRDNIPLTVGIPLTYIADIETGDRPVTDQLNIERAANFARFATNLRAFAARQEAKAPGRMDHITGPVLTAAAVAEKASAAYASGDKEAAKAARAEYAALCVGTVAMAQNG